MQTPRILILGGTGEARALAAALAQTTTHDVLLSLAGRTAAPLAQPVPMRIGGFGGAEGLASTLKEHRFDLMIDATHPFAAKISANAESAARKTGVPAFALRRPPWTPLPGDRWVAASSVEDSVGAIGSDAKRVFLAIGRQEAGAFARAPHHAYLVRSVDPVSPPLAVPDARYLLATGPFGEADEVRLLADHAIDIVVAKNSGGAATYGKIAAARLLGIPVVMIERPPAPAMETVETVADALALVAHLLPPGRKRGV